MGKVENYKKELVILTAPSGAGKTTIAHELLRRLPELSFSVSVTTRSPRPGEIDGKDYYFISVADFKKKVEEKAFVEHEKVYKGKYYGTLYAELDRIWKDHKYPLRVVDVKGADRLKELYGNKAFAIFIKPPSLKILEQRLINRHMEDAKGIQERLDRASKELEYEKYFDATVVNEDLKKAIGEAVQLVKTFIYHTRQ